jgi:hypothetical protein
MAQYIAFPLQRKKIRLYSVYYLRTANYLQEFPMIDLKLINDLLSRISYKPGWNILIEEERVFYNGDNNIIVKCIYEGYESKNAGFEPLSFESERVSETRMRINRSLGKSYRQADKFCYYKRFSKYQLENMPPEQIIKYIIGGTIKEAEMYEFDRWFKFDGVPVFE